MAEYSPITIARFWSKVDVNKSEVACWLLRGAVANGSYGRMKVNGESLTASRIAWELANGETLGEKYALHKCDNPRCCNPHHIYAGSPSDNRRDLHKRQGRSGDKITPEDVKTIRTERKAGISRASLAKEFGVDAAHISQIETGRAWGYNPD